MTNISFAPPNLGIGDTKKNYVFVDEHNRHKRLKVMRACEGCRKRKIKCDAATNNSWPCAACVRLKLTCIPPTVNYNPSHVGLPPSTSGLERVLDFGDSSGDSADEAFIPPPQPRPPPQRSFSYKRPDPLATSKANYMPGVAAFNVTAPPPSAGIVYEAMTTPTLTNGDASYYAHDSFANHMPASAPPTATATTAEWPREEFSVADLQDFMGSLKVNDNGTAPYIVHQKKTLADAPAFEDAEAFALPTMPPESDARVRIPPELMPNDSRAQEYLDIFFRDIHPYVPVISKSYFYRQWNTHRSSISPLLLEAIFAAAGRYSSDPAQGLPWLAMASKHEPCFMDVPRLSTIQALLILLKARESNPKRGYYYRSWMTLKTACTFAKDLELDEHYAQHQAGKACMDVTECQVKTRIWQVIFCGEIIIGGPQGRRDMSASADTVDFSIPPSIPGDEAETRVWRQYMYLARACRQLRGLFEIYGTVKKENGWQSHPKIQALNPSFPNWLNDLPPDMQIHYPADGSPPWLESHVVGFIHCYYHLGVLLLRRPQLMTSSFATSTEWKEHMSASYTSAKAICRIQESLLQNFGVEGLSYGQRGINFVIYCILSSTMLHLAAITIPDPEYNTDAKEFFTRHMRVLESCIDVNPMDDTRAQIESLREAFSADVRKPFMLKPSFPYGSPMANFAPSPPADVSHFTDPVMPSHGPHGLEQAQLDHHQGSFDHHTAHQQFNFQPALTPPISEGMDDKDGPLAVAQVPGLPSDSTGSLDDESVAWNPTQLFHQWNTAFGTPQTTTTPTTVNTTLNHPQSPIYSSTASNVSHHDIPGAAPDAMSSAHYAMSSAGIPSSTPGLANGSATAAYTTSMPQASFVSPSMWQDTVARTYVPRDLKRRYDGVGGPSWNGADHPQVKQRLY